MITLKDLQEKLKDEPNPVFITTKNCDDGSICIGLPYYNHQENELKGWVFYSNNEQDMVYNLLLTFTKEYFKVYRNHPLSKVSMRSLLDAALEQKTKQDENTQ